MQTSQAIVIQDVGIGHVPQLTGGESRHILCLSHSPNWSPTKPEVHTHYVVAMNQKTTALIQMLMEEEVVIVLN